MGMDIMQRLNLGDPNMCGRIPEGIMDSIGELFPESVSYLKNTTIEYSNQEPEIMEKKGLEPKDIRDEIDKLRSEYEENYPEERGPIEQLTHLEALHLFECLIGGQGKQPDWAWELVKKIRDILRKSSWEYVVDGKYDCCRNKITIFTKAFEDIRDQDKRKAKIRRVIAHEAFHAVHYYYAHLNYKEKSYYADVVKEAMADFCSYIICLNDDATRIDGVNESSCHEVAERRYRYWMDNIFFDTPYPNAIFHMYLNEKLDRKDTYDEYCDNGAVNKLKKILHLSIDSMEEAYMELVPEIFRKEPQDKNEKSGRGGIYGGIAADISPSFSQAGSTEWKIIKQIVEKQKIETIESLQNFFGPDVMQISRGRFITLESGEIISAYQQWIINDVKKFADIAEKYGCGPIKLCQYVVVTLGNHPQGFPPVLRCLFDPDDKNEITVGEYVTVKDRDGTEIVGTVQGVIYEIGDYLRYSEHAERIARRI